MSDDIRERPRRPRARSGREGARSAGEMRELARDRLIESRLTPNAISVTGLIGNLIAAVLILEHHFVLAGVAFILGSLCDMFDGRYSRMSGKGTPFGAFLDSTLDRVADGAVLAGLAFFYATDTVHGSEVMLAICLAGLIGTLLTPYTRARAEALGIDGKVGIMQRPERVVLLSAPQAFFGLALNGIVLAAIIVFLSAAAWLTVVQRIAVVRRSWLPQ